MTKIKLDTSDPETRAVWDTVLKARKEVEAWPAWKRGEPPAGRISPPLGAKVQVSGESRKYIVRARDERYAVCTKPHFKTVMYFIADAVEGVRGTENLVFGRGAETDEQCREMLARVAAGETEISHRNRVPWDLVTDDGAVPDPETALKRMTEERDAALREADRLRHNIPIESDFVCPSELERDALAKEIARLLPVVEAADAWCEFEHDSNANTFDVDIQLGHAVLEYRKGRPTVDKIKKAIAWGEQRLQDCARTMRQTRRGTSYDWAYGESVAIQALLQILRVGRAPGET